MMLPLRGSVRGKLSPSQIPSMNNLVGQEVRSRDKNLGQITGPPKKGRHLLEWRRPRARYIVCERQFSFVQRNRNRAAPPGLSRRRLHKHPSLGSSETCQLCRHAPLEEDASSRPESGYALLNCIIVIMVDVLRSTSDELLSHS